jgi:hypothetical protein
MGEETTTTLLEAPTTSGASRRSTNPDDPNDHRLSVGDRVRGHPGATDHRPLMMEALRQLSVAQPATRT